MLCAWLVKHYDIFNADQILLQRCHTFNPIISQGRVLVENQKHCCFTKNLPPDVSFE